jgi:hypothetical protein
MSDIRGGDPHVGIGRAFARPVGSCGLRIQGFLRAYRLASVLLMRVTMPSHWRFSAAG